MVLLVQEVLEEEEEELIGNQGIGFCTLGAAGGNGEIVYRFLRVS
jgi:hypothetical protein